MPPMRMHECVPLAGCSDKKKEAPTEAALLLPGPRAAITLEDAICLPCSRIEYGKNWSRVSPAMAPQIIYLGGRQWLFQSHGHHLAASSGSRVVPGASLRTASTSGKSVSRSSRMV